MNGEPHDFFVSLKMPDPPIWKVQMVDGVWWHIPADKKPPNAFHRLMHRLVFGLKWERI